VGSGTFEVTVIYRAGHQRIKCKVTIQARGVQRVEEVPPDAPDTDGMGLTLIITLMGERLWVQEPYLDVAAAWRDALKASYDGD
jgi:hypothetical protein